MVMVQALRPLKSRPKDAVRLATLSYNTVQRVFFLELVQEFDSGGGSGSKVGPASGRSTLKIAPPFALSA
jgi:hypothetical protein